MFLCYLVNLFGSIVVATINWIIYYTPDDIKCFMVNPFGPLFASFLLVIIIIIYLIIYLCIFEIQWRREKRDFEFRRSTWR